MVLAVVHAHMSQSGDIEAACNEWHGCVCVKHQNESFDSALEALSCCIMIIPGHQELSSLTVHAVQSPVGQSLYERKLWCP